MRMSLLANKMLKHWVTWAIILFFVSLTPKPSTSAPLKCSQPINEGHLDNHYITEVLSTLSSDNMGGRKFGAPSGYKAGDYLAKEFARFTLAFDSAYKKEFKKQRIFGQKKTGYNIVGYVKGKKFPTKYILISAHYDHLGKLEGKIFNGADDNASGVAALLALAKYFKNYPPNYSVLFIATDGEEENLAGAKAFVKQPVIELKHLILNINVDMIGQPGKNKRLYLLPSLDLKPTPQFKEHVVKLSGVCTRFGRPVRTRDIDGGIARTDWHNASDHKVFHDQGIPYIFMGVADHKHYHKPSDTFETINLEFLFAAAETALFVMTLADQSPTSIGLNQ